jgi:GxxExxY protein
VNELNEVTEKVIGCAIEVHRHLGPGLLENVYFNSKLRKEGIKRFIL